MWHTDCQSLLTYGEREWYEFPRRGILSQSSLYWCIFSQGGSTIECFLQIICSYVIIINQKQTFGLFRKQINLFSLRYVEINMIFIRKLCDIANSLKYILFLANIAILGIYWCNAWMITLLIMSPVATCKLI